MVGLWRSVGQKVTGNFMDVVKSRFEERLGQAGIDEAGGVRKEVWIGDPDGSRRACCEAP